MAREYMRVMVNATGCGFDSYFEGMKDLIFSSLRSGVGVESNAMSLKFGGKCLPWCMRDKKKSSWFA